MADKGQKTKGILKNMLASGRARPDPREVAVQHAKSIQHRKELESEILESLILLSQYPLVREAPFTTSNPSPSDSTGFKTHVRLFQPSDYDDLIEERNGQNLCGYTLCSQPRRVTGSGGEWKLTASGDIIKRKEFEKWCSQQCARRALYVKVQLNETAAWERAGIPDIHIDLLDEGQSQTETDQAAHKLANLQLEDQRKEQRDATALALERGEQPSSAAGTQRKLEIRLKEKKTQMPDMTALTTDTSGDHLSIEGHKPKLGGNKTT